MVHHNASKLPLAYKLVAPGANQSSRSKVSDLGLRAEPRPEPDSLRTLIVTARSTIRRAMRNEWEQAWEKYKHGRELYKLGVRPGKAILDTRARAYRVISSIITQMRTGKVGLWAYLHAINKADTD